MLPGGAEQAEWILTTVACKGKLLSEFDLVDMIYGEDVDALSRSSFQAVEKRRCATPIPLLLLLFMGVCRFTKEGRPGKGEILIGEEENRRR
ncbi:hypothetical protein LINPERPRIM_LOCUS6644 [Linum perenne]